MSERPESMPETDVIDLLLRQHAEIRRLFDEVAAADGAERTAAFDRLRRLLAVHETAEEEIVHPYARSTVKNGHKVVDARLAEENNAKQMLSKLEKMGTDDAGFAHLLGELRAAVLDHAQHEEEEEFPRIRQHATEEQLRGMAAAVKAAEAMAPTHPHPGVESVSANLLVGPFAAMMDRTRDVIRKAVGKQKG
ncbi:MAG TPA: hemerythrin domain-containing protein [Streptosporangiaceae bacterium]|nr:hemerythrin domain-containing protein [Streptosporangiaceae bacterium]